VVQIFLLTAWFFANPYLASEPQVTDDTLAAADSPPNILLILADDMGYGDLSCYGSTQIKTEHLDRLAAGGIRFTNAYVTASVCAPSRAGLLTGRYQQRFGFEHNLSNPKHVKEEAIGIPIDEILVSDRLQALGYRTGLIGKWHVGEATKAHHPNARGFDYFFGMLGGSHRYWPTLENNRLMRNQAKISEIAVAYLTDWFSQEAIDFVGKEDDRPWFLYLSYNTPHTPMQAKDQDLRRFENIQPKRRRAYCAMQHCMDQNIGKIIAKLEATGQLENTLIVFASDNGGSVTASSAINAPLNGMKGTFLEGGLRVPMIMHWPAKFKPAQVDDRPVITLDLIQTFVAAAGGNVVPETVGRGKWAYQKIYDGVDLTPFLTEKFDTLPHESLFWRMALRGSAVRDGDWKLIQTPHHPTMLFDLSNDESEQHNLAAEMPEKVAELTRKYAAWQESFRTNPKWISENKWSRYNRKLYDVDYELAQPTGERTRH
jgi:arylsulfatase B